MYMYWEGLLLGQLGFGCSTLCLCLLRLLGKLAEMAKQVWWKMVENHKTQSPQPNVVSRCHAPPCKRILDQRDEQRALSPSMTPTSSAPPN